MPRIPDHELAHLKRSTDLVALVRAAGVELTGKGKDYLGLCPFHEDREPSLVVSPEKGLWHCLGACGEGGSVVDWVMKRQGVSFREAVEVLRRRLGEPPATSSTKSAEPPPEPPVPAPERSALLEEVVAAYQEAFASSPRAGDYAAHRVVSPEAVARFRIGYTDGRVLGQVLDGKEGQAKREVLKRLGVLKSSTGKEHLAGCLVVPVIAPSGDVVNLYGRRIAPAKGQTPHLYLPGPRRGVWNEEALASSPEVVLCESLLDALTFVSAGIEHVTTAWGTNGFTEDHLAAFRRHGTKRIYLAYDHDAAGDEAAAALAPRLAFEGIEVFRVLFPRGMDANDYAKEVQPAGKSLRLVLEAAVPMADTAADAPRTAALAAQSTEAPPPPESSSSHGPDPAVSGSREPAFDPRRPLERAIGDRRWRVRGLEKNLAYQKLQVLVRVAKGEAFFVDGVDLTQAKQRSAFLRHAATELEVEEEVLKQDLAKIHLELEALQDRLIQRELAPGKEGPEPMAAEEEKAALEYLRRPDLLSAILADFAACGVVGEETNKLLGYVACVSRKLERPLAVIVQSSSAAGKSSLMEAILAFVPEEERVQYSAMTGQSLFYMGETDLAHKVLAIVEEEGAERAAYALKLLQSEGELTIASTGKDPATGKLVTHEYRVEGPVMIFLTTTAIEIDEELLNRCLVLTVDESREQTRAIHRLQRERRTLEGLLARRRREAIVALHRNVQRLLRPLPVVNPYAPRLTFLDSQTRTRRDHEKYLTLIDAIALLHQHQRETKRAAGPEGGGIEYLEVTLADIEVANRLAAEILGRTLDELPPQTRAFLEDLDAMVAADCEALEMDRAHYRFGRRQVAESTAWSYNQVRKHIDRLVELEYVVAHRGGRGQSFVYELLWSGEGTEGQPFLVQLLDVDALRGPKANGGLTPSEESLTPRTGRFDPSLAPHSPPMDPSLWDGVTEEEANGDGASRPIGAASGGKRTSRANGSADVQPAASEGA